MVGLSAIATTDNPAASDRVLCGAVPEMLSHPQSRSQGPVTRALTAIAARPAAVTQQKADAIARRSRSGACERRNKITPAMASTVSVSPGNSCRSPPFKAAVHPQSADNGDAVTNELRSALYSTTSLKKSRVRL